MSYNNDRLGSRNSRKDSKVNISLELESTNSQKIQKKEKVNEFYINNDNM
jgi:hypothetical protein|tara:strand:- start:207 stop:356 length:150 start_codon:yes stop_codon:yes gene_type:complete